MKHIWQAYKCVNLVRLELVCRPKPNCVNIVDIQVILYLLLKIPKNVKMGDMNNRSLLEAYQCVFFLHISFNQINKNNEVKTRTNKALHIGIMFFLIYTHVDITIFCIIL